jgi:signal transduction histidine kinase/ActR/RegA family two-component response regulator
VRRAPPALLVLLAFLAASSAARGTPLHDRPDRPTSLAGPWRFAPGDHPARASPEFDDSGWQQLRVPTGWGPNGYDGPDSTWAWYRVEVRLGAEALAAYRGGDRQLAIGLGSVDSAYEVFVQGERLGNVGSPGVRPDYDRRAIWRVPSRLLPGDGRLVVALRVWCSHQTRSRAGSLTAGAWLVGAADTLTRRALIDELPKLVLAAIFAAFGLVHLHLAYRRRELTEYLLFGVLALMAAAYTFLRSEWKYATGVGFEPLKHFEHVILWTSAPVFVAFLYRLLGRPVPRLARALQAAYAIGAIVVVVSPGIGTALRLLPLYQALVPLMGLLVVHVTVAELRAGGAEGRMLAAGVVLFSASWFYDLAVDRSYLVGPRLVPWGFAAFLASMMFALAARFSRAHAELESLRRELAARVEERTRALTEANSELSEASRAQSRFLANVTHEIRTPMTGLVGMTGLLLETDLSEEQREYADGVRASAETLLALTNDILDLAKLDAGHLELEEVAMDLAACVEDVLRTHGAVARRRKLRLIRHLGTDVPRWVRADPVRLRQALGNLLSNAVKFTEEGEVALRLSAEESSPTAVRVRFEVSDTGVGISPEERGRLFRAFSQVASSGSRWYGGTGLGLAISQSLVQRMGGSIEVESAPDKGSRFSFALWLERSDESEVESGSRRLESLELQARPVARGGPLGSVLVVEDNEVNARVAARVLERLGYEAEIAGDGREAVAACERRAFDAVLMDCQMPEMDGLEATARIRAVEGARRTPIVALTAGAEERARCLAAGMDDLLPKPFTARQLQRLLDRWVGGVIEEEPAPAPASGAAPSDPENAVDRSVLDELRRYVSPAFLIQTVDAFLALGGETLRELRAAAAAGNHSEVARLAHRIRGSAGTTGAIRFAEMCARLEERAAETSAVRLLVEEMTVEFERVRAALAMERGRAEWQR